MEGGVVCEEGVEEGEEGGGEVEGASEVEGGEGGGVVEGYEECGDGINSVEGIGRTLVGGRV